jgi:uncharacterized protein (TIGR00251 family)
MKIVVKSGSSQEKVVDKDGLVVYVKEKAIDGKANKAVLKLLKKYFGKSVRIVKGLKSKEKTIFVQDRL